MLLSIQESFLGGSTQIWQPKTSHLQFWRFLEGKDRSWMMMVAFCFVFTYRSVRRRSWTAAVRWARPRERSRSGRWSGSPPWRPAAAARPPLLLYYLENQHQQQLSVLLASVCGVLLPSCHHLTTTVFLLRSAVYSNVSCGACPMYEF